MEHSLRQMNTVGHRESHNKFKKIGIVSSILQITPVDTRNQLQKETWIKHKYTENKEYITKKPIGQ